MKKRKALLWWIFSILFTIAIAYYQRVTGPTYPQKATIQLDKRSFSFQLLRSHSDGDAVIKLPLADKNTTGTLTFKRYRSFDPWTTLSLRREGDCLVAALPHQPPAGKIEYSIKLTRGNESVNLTDNPVIIRFTGNVPAYILIPHILLMFLAMLFSTRTGIEAMIRGTKTLRYTVWTLILLFLGGIVLGPIVQNYAFGAFWTGWPFGHDLTDNKTLVAFLFWLVALFQLRKNPANRFWPIFASIMLLAVYLIPHSVLGSEIDHTKAAKL